MLFPKVLPKIFRLLLAGRAGVSGRAMHIAIVVPVFDGETLLDACLDALLRDEEVPGAAGACIQVLAVDDGSRDRSAQLLRRRAADSNGRLRVLVLGRNRGFAAAVNRGVASLLHDAHSHELAGPRAPDVLVFVNQDCVVSPGWLAPLVRALEDPSVAVAGARLLDADGVTLQHAGACIEPNGLTTHLGRGSRDAGAWRKPMEVDYVCGALFATRPSTWRRFGPFDERYAPAYFEEVDFCVRARRAGMTAVYVPGSEACHREAASSVAGSSTYLLRYHRSRMRFVVRHLLGRSSWHGWLRSEFAWLKTLRRWHDVAPVLAAYARMPSLLLELALDWMRPSLRSRPVRAAAVPEPAAPAGKAP